MCTYSRQGDMDMDMARTFAEIVNRAARAARAARATRAGVFSE